MKATISKWALLVSLPVLAGCPGAIGDPGASADEPGTVDGAGGVGPDGELTAEGTCTDVAAAPLRRLTRRQYENTVADLFGVTAVDASALPDDETVADVFASNWESAVTDAHVRAYMDVAEDVAARAVPSLALPCDPSAGRDCAEAWLRTILGRAWRRPVTDEDVALLLGVFDAGDGFEDGLRLVVATVLEAPDFLYLVESLPTVDEPLVWLSDYEVASRLSYFLWDTLPDDRLFEAASAGALGTADEVEAEARRMLDDPRASRVLERFHREWLGLDGAPAADDPNRELRAAMMEETRRLVSSVIAEGDGTLASLLVSTRAWVDPLLAEHYGVAPPDGGGGFVELPASERAGLLLRADFLSSHPPPEAVVHRGVAIRERVLCSPLGAPPPNAAESGDDRSDPTTACYGCHSLIDPVGATLERFDGLGRLRTEGEGGEPIEDVGAVPGTDIEGEIQGGVELSGALAESDQVRDCVATQWVRFATGRRVEGARDGCSMERIEEAFRRSGGDVRELIARIVRSEMFRARGVEAP